MMESSIAIDEAATADSGTAVDALTFCEAFQRMAAAHPDEPALRRVGDSSAITWHEYAEHVEQLAGALAALGIGHGDTIAMLVSNRPEAHLLDMAAVHLGAIPFNLYKTSSPEQLEYLLDHAESKFVLVEAALAERIAGVVAKLEHVGHVFVLDAEPLDGMQSFDALLATPAPDGFDFTAAWSAITPDDILTLIYTSGTTGPPKGVELTHGNVLGTIRGYHALIPYTLHGRYISYLPMAHFADRLAAHYAAIVSGGCVTSVEDPRAVAQALPEVRPTLWAGMPRVWEKMKAALEAEANSDEFKVALDIGTQRARLMIEGQPIPEELEAAHGRAEAAFAPLREALGLDRARVLHSGAAPIAPEVLEFFIALGLPIFEIYGQTETSAAGCSNRPGAMRVGTVGQALPGTEIRLAEDGEILFRGPGAMRGYRKDPEKTAETIDADGWIHTGDIGEMDDDGFVKIVDRKKEMIINSMGKNMAPANIENAIKSACPLVGSAVAIGDRRPYVTALLVLEPDAAAAFAREHGIDYSSIADLAGDERLRAAVEAGVERANQRLSRVEQIKRFHLLGTDWAAGGDELTPTMKLKRKSISEKYASAIDELYA
jgi:long-subunit acyl-CoA synthetase (AMP-forming)